MDNYQAMIIAQTVFGLIGMLIWYKIGLLKGQNKNSIRIEPSAEPAAQDN